MHRWTVGHNHDTCITVGFNCTLHLLSCSSTRTWQWTACIPEAVRSVLQSFFAVFIFRLGHFNGKVVVYPTARSLENSKKCLSAVIIIVITRCDELTP